jgi:MOSC domain-containing protein YiiM
MHPSVVAVHSNRVHEFSKKTRTEIVLLKGLGIEDDAHCGATVKHRSRVAKDPTQPNLRQVHLIHSELLDQLKVNGHVVTPGALGENITTKGIELLRLPVGTQLHIGSNAVVTVTGLRNPCGQIENFQAGLFSEVLEKKADGTLIRKAGIMGVVTEGGAVKSGDEIRVVLPPEPHRQLNWV